MCDGADPLFRGYRKPAHLFLQELGVPFDDEGVSDVSLCRLVLFFDSDCRSLPRKLCRSQARRLVYVYHSRKGSRFPQRQIIQVRRFHTFSVESLLTRDGATSATAVEDLIMKPDVLGSARLRVAGVVTNYTLVTLGSSLPPAVSL